MKVLVFLSIFTLIIQPDCYSQKVDNYDVELRYSTIRKVIESGISKNLEKKYGDSVLLYFESGFENNRVSIEVNNKQFSNDQLTSDEILDFAKFYNVGSTKNVDSIELIIDDSNVVYIEPDNLRKYIAVNLYDNSIIVEFMDNIPYYD
jgi:hypothetical protein